MRSDPPRFPYCRTRRRSASCRRHPVDHVAGRQVHIVSGQRLGQRAAQPAVIVVADRAQRARLVDDDRHERVGPGAGRQLCEVPEVVDEPVGQIGAHHRAQLPRSRATSTSDFSGTKPSTAGRAAMSAPRRLMRKSRRCVVMARRCQEPRRRGGRDGRPAARLWMNPGCGTPGGSDIVHPALGPSACEIRQTGVDLCSWVWNTTSSSSAQAGRAEGRDRGRQTGQVGGHHRAWPHARRGLRQHRHDPVEDAAGGRALPDRDEPAQSSTAPAIGSRRRSPRPTSWRAPSM